MKKPMPMLRTSQPHDDENFLSYLLRLSEINYFGGVHWLVQLAGLDTSAFNNLSKKMVFGTDVDLSPLSSLCGEHQEALDALRYPLIEKGKLVDFCGHPTSAHALRPMQPKVCPACLAESSHARRVWDLAMVTCCPIHGCLLVDHCPDCGRRISWYRKGVSTCRCEFDLRTIAPKQASDKGGHVTRFVHRLLGRDADLPPGDTPLTRLSLDELFQVVSFFSSFLTRRKTDTSGKALGRGMSVGQLHANFADVVSLFEHWPHNFVSFLQTTDFKPAKNARYGLYHRFGSFYPALKNLFFNDQFAFIRDAFEKYQLKYFSEGYVRHQNLKISDAYKKDAHLSRAETAKQLQTSERWVDRLLDTGKLDGIKVRSGNRHLILVKKSSVYRLHNCYKNLLSISALKKVLRIKRKTIITLINNDLLSCERGPTIDGYPHWQFSINDIEHLMSKIESNVSSQPMRETPSDLITFSETRQMLSAYQFSTLEFCRLVASGQLKPCLRRDIVHIDSFLFSRNAVKKWITNKYQKLILEGYTMEQFKDLIGVSLDAAYEMEKNGLIKARYSGRPKMGKIIDKEAAEQFYRTYITSTEIAKQCGVNASTVIKYLSRAGKRPVSGPSVDGGPRYLYLRKELSDFDFKCIKPSRRARGKLDPNQTSLFDEAA